MAVWYDRMVTEFVGLTPGEDDAHCVFNHLINATHAEMNDLGYSSELPPCRQRR
jgi:hypothetical protein